MPKARTMIPFIAACAGLAAAVSAAPPAPTYVMKAGAGDLYEIQSSQLVAGSTQNADLKTFANEMVTDHQKSTADVKAAAMQAGMTPKPPMLEPKQRANIAALKAAKGKARDALYVRQQKAAHAEALTLHQGYASTGDKPSLKAAAAKITPVVQHHVDMINQMPAM